MPSSVSPAEFGVILIQISVLESPLRRCNRMRPFSGNGSYVAVRRDDSLFHFIWSRQSLGITEERIRFAALPV